MNTFVKSRYVDRYNGNVAKVCEQSSIELLLPLSASASRGNNSMLAQFHQSKIKHY